MQYDFPCSVFLSCCSSAGNAPRLMCQFTHNVLVSRASDWSGLWRLTSSSAVKEIDLVYTEVVGQPHNLTTSALSRRSSAQLAPWRRHGVDEGIEDQGVVTRPCSSRPRCRLRPVSRQAHGRVRRDLASNAPGEKWPAIRYVKPEETSANIPANPSEQVKPRCGRCVRTAVDCTYSTSLAHSTSGLTIIGKVEV